MTVYVVRHAVAVPRSHWNDEDLLRPLTKDGLEQARGLWRILKPRDLRRIYSSPALRCVATVEPMAAKAKVTIKTREHLAEGSDGTATFELLTRLLAAHGDSVVCAHGDQLPLVVGRVAHAHGRLLAPNAEAKKGSTWVLDVGGHGRFRRPRYIPPPE